MRHRQGTSLIDLIISIGDPRGALRRHLSGLFFDHHGDRERQRSERRQRLRSRTRSRPSAILPYASVGTVGGIPSGVIPQAQTAPPADMFFTLTTTVRNIDDPFDGTATGNPPPVDTAPADYKLVSIDATCPLCDNASTMRSRRRSRRKTSKRARSTVRSFLYAIDANGIRFPAPWCSRERISHALRRSYRHDERKRGFGAHRRADEHARISDRRFETGLFHGPDLSARRRGKSESRATEHYSRRADGHRVDVHHRPGEQLTLPRPITAAMPSRTRRSACTGTKLIGTNPNVLKFSTTTVTNASGWPCCPIWNGIPILHARRPIARSRGNDPADAADDQPEFDAVPSSSFLHPRRIRRFS